MSDIAYVLDHIHFIPEEVNFINLKEYSDNVILSYDLDNANNNTHFKRAIAELDRLNFNIGIMILLSENNNIDELIQDIKGYKINLGVWTNDMNIFGNLLSFKDNFITGIIVDYDGFKCPRLGHNGDLDFSEFKKFSFIKESVLTIKINNDFKIIYDKNRLIPIPSTYK